MYFKLRIIRKAPMKMHKIWSLLYLNLPRNSVRIITSTYLILLRVAHFRTPNLNRLSKRIANHVTMIQKDVFTS